MGSPRTPVRRLATTGWASPRWTEGFAIIGRSSLLRSLVVAWALMYFAIDMVSVAEVPLAKVFRAGAVGVGLLEAAFAGGAVLDAFAGRWIRQEWERKALVVDTLATTVDALIVSVTPWFGTALAADFAGSAMDSFASVARYSLIQRRTDDAVRGRVLGAMESTFLLANVVSFVLAGSVIGWIGARGVYALSGAISFCAFVVLALEFGTRRGGARVGPREPGEVEPGVSE